PRRPVPRPRPRPRHGVRREGSRRPDLHLARRRRPVRSPQARDAVRRAAFVAVAALTGLLFAHAAGAAVDAPESARLDSILSSFRARGFMGCALVTRGDDVLLDRGYGFANLAQRIPDAPGVSFRIGSLTKQFTAVAVLLLEE